MANTKTTKKALLMSVISLILCFSMLIGTTFAWFTDEVKSGVNQIIAGNLDVDVLNKNGDSIQGQETLFKDVTLWEPGAVAWENLTVVNLGTLALKYNLTVNFDNANYVVREDAAGNKHAYSLDQILKVAVVDAIDPTISREQLIAGIKDEQWISMKSFAEKGALMPEKNDHIADANKQDIPVKSKTYGIVIYWEPTAEDNNWNVNNGAEVSDYDKNDPLSKNELHIDLGVKLVATQLTAEDDSFGPDYDKGAPWTGAIDTTWYDPAQTTYVINTAEELAGFAALVNGNGAKSTVTKVDFKGKTVKLGNNINLNNVLWTPIHGFGGTFDGDGHVISGLNVQGESNVGFFTWVNIGAKIQNVTFDGAKVVGNHFVGVIIGWEGNESGISYIDNCHVVNSEVICDTDSKLDNGDKAGGLVGYAVTMKITNCSVKNTTIKAYRDFGGILGYANRKTEVSGCTVSGLNLVIDDDVNYKEYTTDAEHDAGLFVGEAASTAQIIGNVANAATAEDLETVLNEAKAGTVIALAEDVDYGTVTVGELKDIVINGAEGTTVIFTTDANTKIENVTLTNIGFEYTGATYDCGVVINANAQIDNLVVDGCTFTGNGTKAGRGLSGQNNNATIVLKNCTFENLGYPVYAWGGYKALTIEGCTFDNIKSWAIMPQGGFNGDLTVTGCTFKNCIGGGLIKAGTLTAGHTFTFTNNTVTGCTVAGDHNWFQFNVSAGTAVTGNNTKEGQPWTPSETDGLK